jgi:hypothetical protein
MKQLLLILSILCLGAIESRSGNTDPQIPIQVIISSGQECPIRAPAYVPIEAYYAGVLSSVCMTFSQNLGVLDITITNLTDGTYADYEVDSSLGSAILPISGNEGFYTLDIMLTSGEQYVGQFEL